MKPTFETLVWLCGSTMYKHSFGKEYTIIAVYIEVKVGPALRGHFLNLKLYCSRSEFTTRLNSLYTLPSRSSQKVQKHYRKVRVVY